MRLHASCCVSSVLCLHLCLLKCLRANVTQLWDVSRAKQDTTSCLFRFLDPQSPFISVCSPTALRLVVPVHQRTHAFLETLSVCEESCISALNMKWPHLWQKDKAVKIKGSKKVAACWSSFVKSLEPQAETQVPKATVRVFNVQKQLEKQTENY